MTKLTGTFRWVATTAMSTPLIATDVSPPCNIALIAYSKINYNLNQNLN